MVTRSGRGGKNHHVLPPREPRLYVQHTRSSSAAPIASRPQSRAHDRAEGETDAVTGGARPHQSHLDAVPVITYIHAHTLSGDLCVRYALLNLERHTSARQLARKPAAHAAQEGVGGRVRESSVTVR